MNKNLIGKKIDEEEDKIIEMYKTVSISDIAKKYAVGISTMYTHLKKWGVPLKIKRGVYPKKGKKRGFVHFKRKFSPELLAKMKKNTEINNQFIKERTRED